MSNESNMNSASRPKRPMGGPGRGMAPGEKAKDFKGSIRKMLRYMGKYKIAVVFVIIIAACSTVFSVAGPKVLGKATTGLDHDRYHTENLLPDAKRNYRKNQSHADEIF